MTYLSIQSRLTGHFQHIFVTFSLHLDLACIVFGWKPCSAKKFSLAFQCGQAKKKPSHIQLKSSFTSNPLCHQSQDNFCARNIAQYHDLPQEAFQSVQKTTPSVFSLSIQIRKTSPKSPFNCKTMKYLMKINKAGIPLWGWKIYAIDLKQKYKYMQRSVTSHVSYNLLSCIFKALQHISNCCFIRCHSAETAHSRWLKRSRY